ncbi:YidB family protein [Kitasatospora sp. NPDC058397]|uniref:YidB family protein n=1 Tax=unclassified Kitasatospora TaxID=2633591 RepID=UPI0036626002
MSEKTDTAPVLGTLLAALAKAPETAGKFDSWAGEGANESVSGEEVAAHLPSGVLTALAERAGVSEAEAAAALAEEIPPLVAAIPAEEIALFRAVGRIADLTPDQLAAARQIAADTKELTARLPQAASWLGDGPNEPVTGEDLDRALGHDTVIRIARATGQGESEAAKGLAAFLPEFVDAISPGGEVDLLALWMVLAQEAPGAAAGPSA